MNDGSTMPPDSAAPATPATPSAAPVPPAVADRHPVRLPDWFRDAQTEKPLDRRDRLRVWLANRDRKVVATVTIGLSVVLLATAGWMVSRVNALPRAVEPEPTTTVVPTSAVGSSGRKVDYFAGSPAAAYLPGAAGITAQPARAEGPFTVVQVRDALATVRQALTEGRLDRSMASGDVEPFVALLAPAARSEIRADFTSDVFLNYATRIATSADQARDAPRAQGRITYRATRDTAGVRVLEITTNVTWVYAFDVIEPADGAGLVAVRDEVVWHVPHPADVPASSRGLWLVSARAVPINVDCAEWKRGFLDVAHPLDLHLPDQMAQADAVYDRTQPLPTATC
ncbi:hypothetical protein [Micromonospora echinofusca]|uniref:Conjugative transposon protein TcpC n=1 Tax=Micromonospora echinofusca TaxID=47858 RepID=A0ABS3VTP4_MICEH|nr:hypothetical protein [Micromonospora echinofusca]MBO4207906.1 hypothetical protein [Micromonospora echinofusca]